jgi:hypothetical protein
VIVDLPDPHSFGPRIRDVRSILWFAANTQVRHCDGALVTWVFTFTTAVYIIVRLRPLLADTA